MLPFELTKDTPYLALSGQLWSVFYEYFNRNWSCYKGFLLYFISTEWLFPIFCSKTPIYSPWNTTLIGSTTLSSVVEGAPVSTLTLNTLRPRQNGRHFADIFKRIFLNENIWIPIKISLKFVPKGSFNNIPALVQIMAWCRPGDKPLCETMLVS